ncbi:MAG: DMT family transporter [Lachnospiraceae bacterium]|nr:DMT family transporter [Lachnospiraceae bacterium]
MSQKQKGICCILASAFFFAIMNMMVRLAGDLPSVQKSFFRNFIAMLFSLAVVLKEKDSFHFQKKNLPILFLRAFAGTVGILCNYYAVDHLVLSDATMLNKLSPFFVIIFSWLFLKENVSLSQGLSVLIAFGGSLFIIKPTFSNVHLGAALIGVLGGLGAGIAYTAVRYLGMKGENKSFIIFFFSAFSCVVTLPFLIFDYHPMSFSQVACLLGAGLAAAGGQFGITYAYTYAPGREISVYDYSIVLFSALLGFIFLHQIPDRYSVIGYFIVCGIAVFSFFYEGKKEKDEAALS